MVQRGAIENAFITLMSDYGSEEEPKFPDVASSPPRTRSILRKASGSGSPRSQKSVSICEDRPNPMSREARLGLKKKKANVPPPEAPQPETKQKVAEDQPEIMMQYSYTSFAGKKKESDTRPDTTASTNCKGCSLI